MPQELKLAFHEIVKERLKKEFDLKGIPLDEDMKYKKVEKGSDVMEHISESYHTDKIKVIKLGELNANRGESSIFIRNAVLVPEDGYDFPIISYDFVEGKRLFAVLDFHPLRKGDDYRKKYIEPLKPLHEKFEKEIPAIEGAKQIMSDWAKQFSSGYYLYKRCSKEFEAKVEEALNMYLDLYIGYVKDAKPLEDAAPRKEVLDTIEEYKKVLRENDPGLGPVKKFFGEEWAHKLFANFPF